MANRPLLLCIALLYFGARTGAAVAQAPASPPPGNGEVQPLPGGIVKLPVTPPPVGPQGALPAPAAPIAPADRPLERSPQLASVLARLKVQPLTLNDALAVALTTNPALAAAGESLYRARGRTAETHSAFGPFLGGDIGDTYRHHDPQAAFDAVATLPFDIMGLLRAASDQAQFQEVGARLDVNRARNQIVFNVKTAFFNVLRAEAFVGVATENLENSVESLRQSEVKYNARTVSYFDVVRAQTDVANAQKQLIQARNGVSLSAGALNNAIGVDVAAPAHVSDAGAVDQPPDVAPPSAAPMLPATDVPPSGTGIGPELSAPPPSALALAPGRLKTARPQAVIDEALKLGPEFQPVLNEALRTRPEILEADAGIAAARKGILIARSSILPSLALAAGYFDTRNQTGEHHIDEPQAELVLSVPLYDAGEARARVQQARADVATAITTKREVVDSVSLDVEQAYLNVIQARDQVAVANQGLDQARAAFQLARTRYAAGVSTRAGISPLLELSDAQAALTLAEGNQVNALYDYNAARAQLDRSIGRFAFVLNGPGYPAVPPSRVVGVRP